MLYIADGIPSSDPVDRTVPEVILEQREGALVFGPCAFAQSLPQPSPFLSGDTDRCSATKGDIGKAVGTATALVPVRNALGPVDDLEIEGIDGVTVGVHARPALSEFASLLHETFSVLSVTIGQPIYRSVDFEKLRCLEAHRLSFVLSTQAPNDLSLAYDPLKLLRNLVDDSESLAAPTQILSIHLAHPLYV